MYLLSDSVTNKRVAVTFKKIHPLGSSHVLLASRWADPAQLTVGYHSFIVTIMVRAVTGFSTFRADFRYVLCVHISNQI